MSRESWPYDPMWKTTEGGRFFYTDYDGETLVIYTRRSRKDPNQKVLWIDKKGQGPVLIRPEHIGMILKVLNGERVPDSE